MASVERLPVSAIVPTKDRSDGLRMLLGTMAAQPVQVAEIVVIDASRDDASVRVCTERTEGLASEIRYERAVVTGAAVQRNQGVRLATQPFILFTEDDVRLEDDCLERLWRALRDDPGVGGVSAFIRNQHYSSPGTASRLLFAVLNGKALKSYAGRCIGPAMNLLPEDAPDLPDIVPVDWLNLGCTLYRREALPDPVFSPFFTGYSLMEDVALSVTVARSWRLANVRSAQIVHHSQPGDHKSSVSAMARMELVNRHYVMTEVLGRRRPADYLRLALLQLFHLGNGLRSLHGLRRTPATLRGKCLAVIDIVSGRRTPLAGAARPVTQ